MFGSSWTQRRQGEPYVSTFHGDTETEWGPALSYYSMLLYFTVAHYTILYLTTLLDYTILYYTVLYFTIQSSMETQRQGTLLYCNELHHSMLYAFYNTTLYYTVLYYSWLAFYEGTETGSSCTALYKTILYFVLYNNFTAPLDFTKLPLQYT